MGELHMTKVAVGCGDIETLQFHMTERVAADGEAHIHTRYLPKRADEMIGGSLYWIIRHKLVARQQILGFSKAVDAQGKPYIRIILGAQVIPVLPQPRRAHQGWRYLAAADAPRDFATGDETGALPSDLMNDLTELGLL